VIHGQLRTTYARAREAQRLADRLVTLGKEGSVHSRRRAFQVLQDRTLVKQLFADIAPRFVGVPGGYTRVVRLGLRRGDGAQTAMLAFSRLPAITPAAPAAARRPAPSPDAPSTPSPTQPKPGDGEKEGKGFFEGLRNLWGRKKKG
jgi:large subunit ribosomal protein L17